MNVKSGTVLEPLFYDGPGETIGDVSLSQQMFSYDTDKGLVVGRTFNVMFSIDRPVHEVWSIYKDFNIWQNKFGHFYSGVVGDLYHSEEHDLGRETFAMSTDPENLGRHEFTILRVIPGHGMVIFQPIPDEDATESRFFFGRGGISPGFHIYTLNGQGDKTVVTILMEHATRTTGLSIEEALAPWRTMLEAGHRKFRDMMIPELKALVYERSAA
jgi:hypothetical protein